MKKVRLKIKNKTNNNEIKRNNLELEIRSKSNELIETEKRIKDLKIDIQKDNDSGNLDPRGAWVIIIFIIFMLMLFLGTYGFNMIQNILQPINKLFY